MLLRKKAAVQKSIKRIMQRISKENVKPTSRALGKLTHSSPGLLFEYVSETNITGRNTVHAVITIIQSSVDNKFYITIIT